MGVEFFEDESWQTKNKPGLNGLNSRQSPNKSGITEWVIKRGYAKDKKQATVILLVTIVICTLIAIIWPTVITNNDRIIIYQEDIDTEGMSAQEAASILKNYPSKHER